MIISRVSVGRCQDFIGDSTPRAHRHRQRAVDRFAYFGANHAPIFAPYVGFLIQREGHGFEGAFGQQRQLGIADETHGVVGGALVGRDDARRQPALAVIAYPHGRERMAGSRFGLIQAKCGLRTPRDRRTAPSWYGRLRAIASPGTGRGAGWRPPRLRPVFAAAPSATGAGAGAAARGRGDGAMRAMARGAGAKPGRAAPWAPPFACVSFCRSSASSIRGATLAAVVTGTSIRSENTAV